MKEGDIIKRFIELLAEAQPSLSESIAQGIECQLRHEYAGERVYIPKRNSHARLMIAERFTGNNAGKLATEMQVCRRTVYYAIKQARQKR